MREEDPHASTPDLALDSETILPDAVFDLLRCLNRGGRRRAFHAAQHGAGAPLAVHAEDDRPEHEQRAEDRRCARQHRRAGAGAERGLAAAAAAERAGHVAPLALLHEDDEQEEKANQQV